HPNALAAVRRGPRQGTLIDGATDPEFIASLLEKMRTSDNIEVGERQLEFRPTKSFRADLKMPIEDIRAVDTEQSNTTALVGSECVVKLFRRLEAGVNPEIEVGRFLTETAPFPNTPPLLGTVELREGGMGSGDLGSAVAVVHRFVQNQGDAWTVTGAYLDRFI